MQPLTDLRAYIEALDAIGEVCHVTAEVELDLEIGAITRRCYSGDFALLARWMSQRTK